MVLALPGSGNLHLDQLAWLKDWQPLVAAAVAFTGASIAAYVAYNNTKKTLQHSEKLEQQRRQRKHAATRAVLPLALAQLTDYAEQSAFLLRGLLGKFEKEVLPSGAISEGAVPRLPSETIKSISEFIEFSDSVDTRVLENTIAWVQIHDSRIRGMVKDDSHSSSKRLTLKINVEEYILDAATIYAGAVAVYNYSRRRQDGIPSTIGWGDVRRALANMRFGELDFPQIEKLLAGREKHSSGPFDVSQ